MTRFERGPFARLEGVPQVPDRTRCYDSQGYAWIEGGKMSLHSTVQIQEINVY